MGPVLAVIVKCLTRGCCICGPLVESFHSAREMCNWCEDVCGMLAMCDGFIRNVQWYLRVGACYPTIGVCVGVL